MALGAAILFYAGAYFLIRRRGFHYEPAALFQPGESRFSVREEDGDAVYSVIPARPSLAPLAVGAASLVALMAGAWALAGDTRNAPAAAALGLAAGLLAFFSPFAGRPSPARRPVEIAWIGGALAADGRRWARDEIAAFAARNPAGANDAPAARARAWALSLVEENGAEVVLANGLTQETAAGLAAALAARTGAPAT